MIGSGPSAAGPEDLEETFRSPEACVTGNGVGFEEFLGFGLHFEAVAQRVGELLRPSTSFSRFFSWSSAGVDDPDGVNFDGPYFSRLAERERLLRFWLRPEHPFLRGMFHVLMGTSGYSR